jgi:hypothetical protein
LSTKSWLCHSVMLVTASITVSPSSVSYSLHCTTSVSFYLLLANLFLIRRQEVKSNRASIQLCVQLLIYRHYSQASLFIRHEHIRCCVISSTDTCLICTSSFFEGNLHVIMIRYLFHPAKDPWSLSHTDTKSRFGLKVGHGRKGAREWTMQVEFLNKT